MSLSRRSLLAAGASLGAGFALRGPGRVLGGVAPAARTFDVCLAPDVIEADPDLLKIVRDAGVSRVWVCGFFYGYWPVPLDRVVECLKHVEKAGMAADVVNIPLGHPGDSLGSKSGNFPLTPPKHWKLGTGPDGKTYAGTSLHAPAAAENAKAVADLAARGVRRVFLDDDFRLARTPGAVGGCYCAEHRRAFLQNAGYEGAKGEQTWADLLDAVRGRRLTPLIRAWVDFSCDELTACFRTMQAAAKDVRLGSMVLYLGSEKAGIRLSDYRDAPMRVGESMFNDGNFSPVRGKTDELFSALFHRRFIAPELAYSESTAFPANGLSAKNMAAKLCISTLADVRTTTFMSGLTPFPRTHWQTLKPAIAKQAAVHAKLAGHVPRGPFKHYWGEAQRYVGDDQPFSLFLATGVPFEVTGEVAADGFTFLADFDADVAAGRLKSSGTTFVTRNGAGATRAVAESLESLFAFKRSIVAHLKVVPVVEQDKPVVCAWYPTARAALLWNLSETREALTVRLGAVRREVIAEPLGTVLVEGLG